MFKYEIQSNICIYSSFETPSKQVQIKSVVGELNYSQPFNPFAAIKII